MINELVGRTKLGGADSGLRAKGRTQEEHFGHERSIQHQLIRGLIKT